MSLKSSGYAAWYGACVAPIIGLWNVYKWWRDRPGFSVNGQCHSPIALPNWNNFLSATESSSYACTEPTEHNRFQQDYY